MTPERWEQVKRLYDGARERQPGERSAFLAQACPGDEELRREVQALLDQPVATADFVNFVGGPALGSAQSGASHGAPSLTGRRLGVYQVQALLGRGGMGDVYRAHDTRLGRDVAIKFLPPAFTSDPDRLARFEREARVVASLNHPHIAAIHGVEESGGIRGLVLELVEGETLAERLARSSTTASRGLPLAETLEYARQIAGALEAAHEKGITHRDLKPANIKLTPDGVVKLLDFGIAKVVIGDGPGLDLTQAATGGATIEGMIVGTAGYMSPEQARGKPVDKRADIWAFGCVLYEMLSGRMAFKGETLSDTLAAILDRDPDWTALPASTPRTVRRLLQRCLEKDARQRLRDIGDARVELEEAQAEPAGNDAIQRSPVVRRPWRALVLAAACLIVGALTAGIVTWNPRPTGSTAPVTRFAVNLSPNEIVHPIGGGDSVAISRDGTRVAIVGNRDGRTQIYVRSIGDLSTRPVPGTDGSSSPIFSPDGQWLAFRHAGSRTIRKVALSGGAPVSICSYNGGYGASWESDDTILFNGDYPGPILRVSADGGTPQPVTELDASKEDRHHYWPELLPGGNALLFSTIRVGTDSFDDGRIEVQSLVTRQRRVLVDGGSLGRYSPTGHLLYARSGTLFAVPFDLDELAVTGTPVPVLEGLSMSLNIPMAHYSVSATGTLVYAPGPAVGSGRTVSWVDRSGKAEQLPLPPRMYLHPRMSPDGRQIAIEIEGPNHNLYTYDLGRGVLSRVALDAFDGNNHWPVWTPSGERLTFRTFGPGGFTMWWMPADRSGPPERLTNIGINQSASSWAPDGKTVAFTQVSSDTGPDVYVLPVGDRNPQPFAQTRFAEGSPKFSPDGRWIAYTSRESGRDEIYVQAYPGPGPKIQVSNDGGTDAMWKRSGGELFYRNGDKMMAVSVTTHPRFSASTPRMLWEGRYAHGMSSACGPPGPTSSNYDVTADGQHFLMVRDSETDSFPTQINVVTNWFDELRQRMTVNDR